jgi:hypothetical protein
MKITIKPKAEQTKQRNLRVPISLDEQMDETTKLADAVGADYHATLLTAIEEFNTAFHAQLLEMKAKGQRATKAGRNSIPPPVAPGDKSGDGISASNGAKLDLP